MSPANARKHWVHWVFVGPRKTPLNPDSWPLNGPRDHPQLDVNCGAPKGGQEPKRSSAHTPPELCRRTDLHHGEFRTKVRELEEEIERLRGF
jgi:hypothetical protein